MTELFLCNFIFLQFYFLIAFVFVPAVYLLCFVAVPGDPCPIQGVSMNTRVHLLTRHHPALRGVSLAWCVMPRTSQLLEKKKMTELFISNFIFIQFFTYSFIFS